MARVLPLFALFIEAAAQSSFERMLDDVNPSRKNSGRKRESRQTPDELMELYNKAYTQFIKDDREEDRLQEAYAEVNARLTQSKKKLGEIEEALAKKKTFDLNAQKTAKATEIKELEALLDFVDAFKIKAVEEEGKSIEAARKAYENATEKNTADDLQTASEEIEEDYIPETPMEHARHIMAEAPGIISEYIDVVQSELNKARGSSRDNGLITSLTKKLKDLERMIIKAGGLRLTEEGKTLINQMLAILWVTSGPKDSQTAKIEQLQAELEEVRSHVAQPAKSSGKQTSTVTPVDNRDAEITELKEQLKQVRASLKQKSQNDQAPSQAQIDLAAATQRADKCQKDLKEEQDSVWKIWVIGALSFAVIAAAAYIVLVK